MRPLHLRRRVRRGGWSVVAGAGAAPAAARGARDLRKDIAPILHAKCITCHRPGEVAPMSLRTFDEVRPWARAIKQKVSARRCRPGLPIPRTACSPTTRA